MTLKMRVWGYLIGASFGHARRRKDWVEASSELAQNRRAWSASVRDVVNAIGDAGSTRPR